MKNQVIECYENEVFITNKNWKCQLDEKDIQLGYYIQVTNMLDATGEKEFEQYPYLFSIGILPKNCHRSFSIDAGLEDSEAKEYSYLGDVNNYMGSVPADHVLLNTDSINKKLLDSLTIKDACLITTKPSHGTVAAQQGPGAEFTYPQFKDEDSCMSFAKQLVEAYGSTHMCLIGFLLDKPINMVGDTGWGIIETAVNGIKLRGSK